MTTSDDRTELKNEELLDEILEVTVGEDSMSEPPTEEAEETAMAPETEETEEEETLEQAVEDEDEGEGEGEEEPESTADEKQPEEKEAAQEEAEDRNSKMKRLLRNMLRDDDGEGGNLKDMFNDLQISGEWLKKHWAFLLIVFFCMLFFVTNRYQAQQEIIEEARLRQELNDWKFVWLTQFSELTRSSRQSNIEENLKQRGDSTLKLSKEAPFIIKVK